jgi:hypothetical protein
MERIHSRHVGVSGVYEKLEKENMKRTMLGSRLNLEAERVCFCSSGALKPVIVCGRGEPGDSHPIINK